MQVRETVVVFASELSHLPTFDQAQGLVGFLCETASTGKSMVHRLKADKAIFLNELFEVSKDPGYISRDFQDQDIIKAMR